MRRTTMFTYLAVAVVCALLATGCGSGASGRSTQHQQHFALILKTMANPVWQSVATGAKSWAKKHGVQLDVAAGKEEDDISGQIDVVENELVKNVDGIAIAPNGTTQLKPVLQKAVQEGVPVVLIDTDIPDFTQKTALVQTDSYGVSKTLSTAFAKELGNTGVAGILSYPGVTSVDLRVRGTKDAIKGTKIKVVSELAGDCLRSKALNATTDMLQAHPNITAIFGECGQNAVGAIQAIKLAGKKPGKDIKVIGFDGVAQELTAIKHGEEYATIYQDFPGLGSKALDAVRKATRKQSVPKTIYVPATTITRANVDKYL